MTYNYTDWGPWGCDHRKLLEFSIALEQGGLVVKNLPAMQETGRRCGFDPWIRKILWRRKWQPTPVFLPRKSHEQRSLAGYSPWGHKESDTTTKQQQIRVVDYFLPKTHTVYTHVHTHLCQTDLKLKAGSVFISHNDGICH